MTRARIFAFAVLAMLALGACDDDTPDTPEIVAKKAQCKDVFAHVYQISPQSDADMKARAGELAAALPEEDVKMCVDAKPEINACILQAPTVAAVKACITAGLKASATP